MGGLTNLVFLDDELVPRSKQTMPVPAALKSPSASRPPMRVQALLNDRTLTVIERPEELEMGTRKLDLLS